MKKNALFSLFPILFGYFVMGFVDIVGIATNYVKKDFELSDTLANYTNDGFFMVCCLFYTYWNFYG